MSGLFTRRTIVAGLAASASSLLAGCDSLGKDEQFRKVLFSAENMHKWLQRSLQDRDALAPEFRPDQRSRLFRGNGTLNPSGADYKALWRGKFVDWRLKVDGLVSRPLSLSLADLRTMPQRIQTTRHDCVEGWSAIGTWRGVPLAKILETAHLSDKARYIVFHCLDDVGGGHRYYESIDLIDAFHPQTILAFALNEQPLEVRNGAPLRLRAERHLGYKQAKFLARVEAVTDLRGIQGGKGGFWEDQADYEWYAGI
jgi:DMSO/TMAO reductase YedYZ molybdopterin-dependent catalytic subunit